MSLNILGGLLKGYSLLAPPEKLTRPTASQLKRRIFDSNQDLTGIRFIDLCAGSGAIGIEAWSRGAKEVILVEYNKKVMSLLSRNYKKLKEKFFVELSERNIILISDSSEKWIDKKWQSAYESGDTVIYLDPPYEKIKIYEDVINSISSKSFRGELWLEGCKQKGKTDVHWCAMLPNVPFKVYKQGTSFIIRFMFGQDE